MQNPHKYIILNEIGQGTFATVFLGKREGYKQEELFAIKVIEKH